MPILYAMFKDEDLHMIMWIPALHVIEGYAPGIPTAGPLSRLNQYCSLQHILMMGNEAGQTRKL